jgi:DNA-binding winged helix-turn-helix (wHTH) protein
MANPIPLPRMRFEAFEVDPQSGQLLKHGHRLHLQEQPFRILLALLDTPGRIVTREELRRSLWREGTHVDFEHGLCTAVNKLREALGDSADQPRFIETIARRGYCFIAPVQKDVPACALTPWQHDAQIVIAALFFCVIVYWLL